jgi:hypothetical protein
MDPKILIFDNAQAAAEACGDRILEILDQARQERGAATLALSGGSTPKLMFRSMVTRKFDWSGVQLFQVDERCVPPDNEQSNFRRSRWAHGEPVSGRAIDSRSNGCRGCSVGGEDEAASCDFAPRSIGADAIFVVSGDGAGKG